MMKTIIIGLGNPILSDDGVGWVVAQTIQSTLGAALADIQVECFSLAGIALMEQIIGYERVILIDSLNTGKFNQGEVVTFTLDSLVDLTYGHTASAHDLSLKNALIMGRSMNAILPNDKNVHIVAIEALHTYTFGETLTPAIKAAVPVAVNQVIQLIDTQQEQPTF